jgi:tetratricopeptide (TPR) repeat protein
MIIGAALLLVGAVSGCGGDKADTTPEGAEPVLSADQHFEQANSYYEQGDLENAAESFEAALALQPSHLGSLTNLGVVYYQMGRLDEAVTQFETGLQVDRSDAQLHYLLGAARLQQGRLEEAEQSFLQAQSLQRDLPETQYGLGALYKLQGRIDEAIAAFERFLDLGPAQDPQAAEEARRQLQELQGQ